MRAKKFLFTWILLLSVLFLFFSNIACADNITVSVDLDTYHKSSTATTSYFDATIIHCYPANGVYMTGMTFDYDIATALSGYSNPQFGETGSYACYTIKEVFNNGVNIYIKWLTEIFDNSATWQQNNASPSTQWTTGDNPSDDWKSEFIGGVLNTTTLWSLSGAGDNINKLTCFELNGTELQSMYERINRASILITAQTSQGFSTFTLDSENATTDKSFLVLNVSEGTPANSPINIDWGMPDIFNTTNTTIFIGLNVSDPELDDEIINCDFASNESGSFGSQNYTSITNGVNFTNSFSMSSEWEIYHTFNITCYGNDSSVASISKEIYFDNTLFVNWDYHSPDNLSNITSIPLTIGFNVSDFENDAISNCTLWTNNSYEDIDTSITNGANSTFSYNVNDQGWIEIWITCTDAKNKNISSSIKTLWIDTEQPTITINNPTSDNSSVFKTSIPTDINISDPNLYAYNITILDSFGNMMLNNYTDDINSSEWDFLEIIDVNNWTDGLYIMIIESSDDHTSNKINNMLVTMDYINKAINFDGINIKYLSSKTMTNLFYAKQSDRYTFDFDFDNPANKEQTYIFEIDPDGKKIVYRSGSEYAGHFVIDNTYWLDFMTNIKDIKYNVYFYDQLWRIAISTISESLHFKSIGGINQNAKSVSFNVDNTAPEISLISPDDQSLINISSHDPFNQSFSFNVSDFTELSNCSLWIDGEINQTRSDISRNTTLSFGENMRENVSILWNINCTDNVGNTGSSSVYNVTFNYTESITPPAPEPEITPTGSSSSAVIEIEPEPEKSLIEKLIDNLTNWTVTMPVFTLLIVIYLVLVFKPDKRQPKTMIYMLLALSCTLLMSSQIVKADYEFYQDVENSSSYFSNWDNSDLLNDSDFNTGANITEDQVAFGRYNFTKPDNSINVTLDFKTECGRFNWSVPQACFDYSDDVAFQIYGAGNDFNFVTPLCHDGSNFVNDTDLSCNVDRVFYELAVWWYISQDLIPPEVNISSPLNETYTSESLDLNFSAVDDVSINSSWYNFTSNSTAVMISDNLTITLPDGQYQVFVCANDSSDNIGCDNQSFVISLPVPEQPITGGSGSREIEPEFESVIGTCDAELNLFGDAIRIWFVKMTPSKFIDLTLDLFRYGWGWIVCLGQGGIVDVRGLK